MRLRDACISMWCWRTMLSYHRWVRHWLSLRTVLWLACTSLSSRLQFASVLSSKGPYSQMYPGSNGQQQRVSCLPRSCLQKSFFFFIDFNFNKLTHVNKKKQQSSFSSITWTRLCIPPSPSFLRGCSVLICGLCTVCFSRFLGWSWTWQGWFTCTAPYSPCCPHTCCIEPSGKDLRSVVLLEVLIDFTLISEKKHFLFSLSFLQLYIFLASLQNISIDC